MSQIPENPQSNLEAKLRESPQRIRAAAMEDISPSIYLQPLVVAGNIEGSYIMIPWNIAAELLDLEEAPPDESHECIHLILNNTGNVNQISFSSKKDHLPILAQYFITVLQQEYESYGFVSLYQLKKYYPNNYQIERRIGEISDQMKLVNVRGLGYLPPNSKTKDRYYYLEIIANQIYHDCADGKIEYEILRVSKTISDYSYTTLKLPPNTLPKADGDIYRMYLVQFGNQAFPLILSPLEYQLFILLFQNSGYVDRTIWQNSGYQGDATSLRLASQKLNQKLMHALSSRKPIVFSNGLGYNLGTAHRMDFLEKQELNYLGRQGITAFLYLDIDQLNLESPTVLPQKIGDGGTFIFVQIKNSDFTVNLEIPPTEFAVLTAFAQNGFENITTFDAIPDDVPDYEVKRRVFRTAFINLMKRLGKYFEIPDLSSLTEFKNNVNRYTFPILKLRAES